MSGYDEALARLPRTFTTRTAQANGISRTGLHRLKLAGAVVELSRGVYRNADAPESAHLDLLAVAHRVPRAVVCLISALALHELTDEVPVAAQFAVPRPRNLPVVGYPPVEFVRFDAETFDLGRGEFEAAPGEPVPVYDAARSVVDAMRLRHRVGEPVALRALRHYLTRRDARPGDLVSYARQLDVEGPVTKAVDVVLS
ncbi:type IV toxin-antitoxin system AbiEi family antitoxin domain-containing protein [Amycolatopsis nigrescens]|uniref:type IV toxin-antitoxin system AbiEi family antitoxin domain-containing protein n=1 Tax=Amycolatopsis nigrescens TaxID=381445 RepID=UPI00035D199D|nr:type IV toxin-antitoxin system AbiEi family antitoxin domain-containing protein [Amycolatopsis nigrescens]